MTYYPARKLLLVAFVLLVYIAVGVGLKIALDSGVLDYAPVPNVADRITVAPVTAQDSLLTAMQYVEEQLVLDNGFVILYQSSDPQSAVDGHNQTNSEAVSYRLLWAARAGDKEVFDAQLDFIEEHMLHPTLGYMQWRLEADLKPHGDGINIATDADLRSIKALLIAERRWGDARYTRMIDTLASALERMAITDDGYFAPYAGPVGVNDVWRTQEVYLSYADFNVFRDLAQRRGQPWHIVYDNTKNAFLEAQIHNGLYNSYMNMRRQYGNGIDGGGYSINSMWMMVRAAESDDKELVRSARKSLGFYQKEFPRENALYGSYSSDGLPLEGYEDPWAYALVARAAIELGEEEFASELIDRLIAMQDVDPESPFFGSFPEGGSGDSRSGQFTVQESIITLQRYVQVVGGK
jgi:endo-1,4-beta-D-glucanase Y